MNGVWVWVVFAIAGIAMYLLIDFRYRKKRGAYAVGDWVTVESEGQFWFAELGERRDEKFRVAWIDYAESSRPKPKTLLTLVYADEPPEATKFEWLTVAELRDRKAKYVWRPGASLGWDRVSEILLPWGWTP